SANAVGFLRMPSRKGTEECRIRKNEGGRCGRKVEHSLAEQDGGRESGTEISRAEMPVVTVTARLSVVDLLDVCRIHHRANDDLRIVLVKRRQDSFSWIHIVGRID